MSHHEHENHINQTDPTHQILPGSRKVSSNQHEHEKSPPHHHALTGHVHKHHYVHKEIDTEAEELLGKENTLNGPQDPLLIYEAELAEDYYALAWCALKKDIWKDKSVYNVPIFFTRYNYIRLMIDFIIFAILISFTITVMLWQTFTSSTFKLANWRIEVLRILIVGFAQRLLFPEVFRGVTKFRYSLRNQGNFHYPWFAIFIPFWQIFMSIISYCLIVIFMCVSKEALPLVMHFAEVAILIELDDWIGEAICKEYPDEGEKPEDIDEESLKNLNEEMIYPNKLALIREDLEIVSNLNVPYSNCLLRVMSSILSYFPWYLLPFVSTLSFEYILAYYQPAMVKIIT